MKNYRYAEFVNDGYEYLMLLKKKLINGHYFYVWEGASDLFTLAPQKTIMGAIAIFKEKMTDLKANTI